MCIHEEKIIWGLGDSDLIAQKCERMMHINQALYRNKDNHLEFLPLECLQIIVLYLGRIDSHDPTRRLIAIPKAELERVFGKRFTNDSLTRWLDILHQGIVIDRTNEHWIAIFDESYIKSKIIKGKRTISCIYLKCSESAERYIFDIDYLGYAKIHSREVSKLTSRYSFVLYDYLVLNLGLKAPKTHREWTVSVDSLRKIMCYRPDSEFVFRDFSKYALNKAINEINEKTDLTVSYTKKCEWNTCTHIIFSVSRDVPSNSTSDSGDCIDLPEAEAQLFDQIMKTLSDMDPHITNTSAMETYNLLKERSIILADEATEALVERMKANFAACYRQARIHSPNRSQPRIGLLTSIIDNNIHSGLFSSLKKTNLRKTGKQRGISIDSPLPVKSNDTSAPDDFHDPILDLYRNDDY